MSDTINSTLDQISNILAATDEALAAWNGNGNLQFPALLSMLAAKMNWDEKQLREADPIIRYYIRRNPDWHVTRGAKGGIMRASDKQKKEESKVAKEFVKKQMQVALEAKMAQMAAATTSMKSEVQEDENEDEVDNLFSDE